MKSPLMGPDILIHLGDIYYSCTAFEANRFYDNLRSAFKDPGIRIFSLCGNHDMYSGAAPYYALLNRIGQPASFFCIRNSSWQVLVGDTGWNDFKPYTGGMDATWIRDRDEGDSYSELDWHKDKLINAGGRRTIFMTHHQLFTRNESIAHEPSLYNQRSGMAGKKSVNAYLMDEFRSFIPDLSLWLWGHEHNQVIYKPFNGLKRGRCIGASGIPVAWEAQLYTVSADLADQDVPELIDGSDKTKLQIDGSGDVYQLGYAILNLKGPKGTIEYFQFDPPSKTSTSMFKENLD